MVLLVIGQLMTLGGGGLGGGVLRLGDLLLARLWGEGDLGETSGLDTGVYSSIGGGDGGDSCSGGGGASGSGGGGRKADTVLDSLGLGGVAGLGGGTVWDAEDGGGGVGAVAATVAKSRILVKVLRNGPPPSAPYLCRARSTARLTMTWVKSGGVNTPSSVILDCTQVSPSFFSPMTTSRKRESNPP